MTATETVLIGSNVMMAVGTLGMFFVARRPQKNQVSFDPTYASKEDFDKHVLWDTREHERLQANSDQDRRELFAKIGALERGAGTRMESLGKEWRALVEAKFDELATRHDEDRQRLWEKVSRIGEDLAGLAASAKQTGQRVEQLDAKIDLFQRRAL
jgi:hypothetical protein